MDGLRPGMRVFVVVVVGAGMGGLCSAALLTHYGYKTLVAEKLPDQGNIFQYYP